MGLKEKQEGSDDIFPSEYEAELAKDARDKLVSLFKKKEQYYEFEISEKNGAKEKIKIPSTALTFFFEILKQMANGNTVTVIPHNAQLTTQEAANFLNVSRPYLIKLLDTNKIPHVKIGRHRRIKFDDILKYKNFILIESEKARTELTQQAQDLNLGY